MDMGGHPHRNRPELLVCSLFQGRAGSNDPTQERAGKQRCIPLFG